jgi:UDP-MurNAc hydroxylase
VRVTSLGHAGFHLDTTGGGIVCDPWFTPTFFGSWHPFPRVDTVDLDLLHDAKFLYISHMHRDHLDPDVLTQHVPTSVTVLLPEFGVNALEDTLRSLGYNNIIRTHNGEIVEVDGDLRIAIGSLAGPHIGPMGDSMLVVSDPTAVVLNQNDAHPADLDMGLVFGQPDAHLLQYSGAIWYPMVYEIPADEEAALIATKRERQVARAIQYIEMAGARHVVPSAGPPCFLDPELFHLNDFSGIEANANPSIFPDAVQFLAELDAVGHHEGQLLIPGSTLEVGGERDGEVTHPISTDDVDRIFSDKRSYLERYQADTADIRAQIVAGWPTDTTDVFAAIKDWFEPILTDAHHTRAGVGGLVELATTDGERIIIDMPAGVVRRPADDDVIAFRFRTSRALLESSVRRRVDDWCNELFLSCRFEAYRAGPYNEYIYTFFKSLSEPRMAYAERFYQAKADDRDVDWIECDGWIVESRCPHQRARLDRVGSVDGEVLTCCLHGWQFDLTTGECLNSDGAFLRVKGRAPVND